MGLRVVADTMPHLPASLRRGLARWSCRTTKRLPPARVLSLSLAAALGCQGNGQLPSADSLGVAEVDFSIAACAPTGPVQVDTVARGLDTPWDVAFLSTGEAYITERPGRIRRISSEGELDATTWVTVDVYSPEGSEVGLMGVDVDPSARHLYLSATRPVSAGLGPRLARVVAGLSNPDRRQGLTLNVYRVALDGSRELEEVVGGIPAGYSHGGGALRFGPDGLLYLTNGDGGNPPRAQNPSSYFGKFLRYLPDGSIPSENPDPDSPVFASGIRHSQGLAWWDRELFLIDHGPTGSESENFRTDHDELNSVTAGANFGWPIVAGSTEGGELTPPLVEWTPALVPAGLARFDGPGTPWDGSLFVTGLRGARLVRIEVAERADGIRATCTEDFLQSSYGRLRLVRQAPDGSLWVGTSNRDDRGVPREHDDMILRLRPTEPS